MDNYAIGRYPKKKSAAGGKDIFTHPGSLGTRSRQMAMIALYEAPLQMLCDSPTKYEREQPTTDFIRQIPTVFDEIIGLDGQIGEYAVIAKRKGTTWYVAAMTNWKARDLTITFSMLSEGAHQIEVFADGVNADRDANDYVKTSHTVKKGDSVKVHLAPGGGWSAIVK
jgi:alpha-glucosidase